MQNEVKMATVLPCNSFFCDENSTGLCCTTGRRIRSSRYCLQTVTTKSLFTLSCLFIVTEYVTSFLIATGQPANMSRTSEVVDFWDQWREIIVHENYPEPVHSATGGLLNKTTPVICGGGINNWPPFSSLCYTLTEPPDPAANDTDLPEDPEPVAVMSQARWGAASIVIHDGNTLWVTGGTNGRNDLSSTEFITLTDGSGPGPDLPVPVRSHCLVELDADRIMLIGGVSSSGGETRSKGTWIFHMNTLEWTMGPDLRIGRRYHSCGIVRDEDNGTITDLLVVTGNHL